MSTQTMPSCDNRQYTAAAIVELHRIADAPSRQEIVEAFAAFVALGDSASILFDLFVALRAYGVDASIVECVLAHMPAD